MERWIRRPKTAQSLALRARIVLASAEGLSDQAIAEKLGISRATTGKWRRRFLKEGCDGLFDLPRPGKPRTVSDEEVEQVVTKTLESLPENATHWSTRKMSEATGVSTTTVSGIWRAFGLKPHRVETFKLSTDPLFIEKVRDIVGLYMSPPERAVVLCIDEKNPRFRRWIERNPFCRCNQGSRSIEPTTTGAMIHFFVCGPECGNR